MPEEIHTPSDLLEALDALHSNVVDNMDGDPMFGQCVGLIENAMNDLRCWIEGADVGDDIP